MNYMRKLMETVTLHESAKDITDVVERTLESNRQRQEALQDAEAEAYADATRAIQKANKRMQEIASDATEVGVATNPWSQRGVFYRGLGTEGDPEQVINWVKKHWPRSNVGKIIADAQEAAYAAGTEIEWNDAAALLRAKEIEPWRTFAPSYMIVLNGQTAKNQEVTVYFDSTPKMGTKKLIVDGSTYSKNWGPFAFE